MKVYYQKYQKDFIIASITEAKDRVMADFQCSEKRHEKPSIQQY
jgi:hypothetical protein